MTKKNRIGPVVDKRVFLSLFLRTISGKFEQGPPCIIKTTTIFMNGLSSEHTLGN